MHKILCNHKSSVCHLLPGRQRHASDAGINAVIHSRTFWQARRNTTVKSAWRTLPASPAAAFPPYTRPSTSELTPQSSTKDLRVEFLLVFTNFRTVTLWADIRWVDVDNGALPRIFSPDRLRFCIRRWNQRHMQSRNMRVFGYISHLTCL